jgi:hypothetical protein
LGFQRLAATHAATPHRAGIRPREGIAFEEGMTGDAVDNLRLLLDLKSGVDVASFKVVLQRPRRLTVS